MLDVDVAIRINVFPPDVYFLTGRACVPGIGTSLVNSMTCYAEMRISDFFTLLFFHCVPPFLHSGQVFGFGYHIVVFAIETSEFDAIVSGGRFSGVGVAPCTAFYR